MPWAPRVGARVEHLAGAVLLEVAPPCREIGGQLGHQLAVFRDGPATSAGRVGRPVASRTMFVIMTAHNGSSRVCGSRHRWQAVPRGRLQTQRGPGWRLRPPGPWLFVDVSPGRRVLRWTHCASSAGEYLIDLPTRM
jgi:hypothetical protein